MKIKFNRDYQVKAENGRFFEKDGTYDLTDESAGHFLKRKVAAKAASGKVLEPTVVAAPSVVTSVMANATAEAVSGDKAKARKKDK